MKTCDNGDTQPVSPQKSVFFKSLSFVKAVFKSFLYLGLLPAFASSASAQDMVFLYHGLGTGPWHMGGIAKKLEAGGYKVFNLDYNTMSALTTGGQQERTRVQSMISGQNGTVSFVGHSMGGIYIRAILNGWKPQNMGRVVIIGSPNTGGTRAANLPEFGSFFSGANSQAIKILQPGNQDTMKAMGNGSNLGYELGTIAGDTMGGSDGLFTVASVRVPGSKDHVTVNVGHASQPQTAQVQQLTYNFLASGKFNPTAEDIAGARAPQGANQGQQNQLMNNQTTSSTLATAGSQTMTTGGGTTESAGFGSMMGGGTTGGGLSSMMGGGTTGGGLSSMMGGGTTGGGLSSMMGGGTTGGGLSSMMGGGTTGGGLSSMMGGGTTGGGLSSMMGGGTTGGGLSSMMGGGAGGGSPFGGTTGGGLSSMMGGGAGGGSPFGGTTGEGLSSMMGGGAGGGSPFGGTTGGGLGSMLGGGAGGGSPFGGTTGGGLGSMLGGGAGGGSPFGGTTGGGLGSMLGGGAGGGSPFGGTTGGGLGSMLGGGAGGGSPFGGTTGGGLGSMLGGG